MRFQKKIKKLLTPSQIPNLPSNQISIRQHVTEEEHLFNFLTTEFPLIQFSEEFCEFYKNHDYIYPILRDFHTVLKENPHLKLSDLIYDSTEYFDVEREYLIDLAYFNDHDYLIDVIICSKKPLYEQAYLLNMIYHKGYLTNDKIDKLQKKIIIEGTFDLLNELKEYNCINLKNITDERHEEHIDYF